MSPALGPAGNNLLDRCGAFHAPRTYGVAHVLEHGFISGLGVRDSAQPPQPQQVVQLPVLLRSPGTIHRDLVLRQELLMKPGRQNMQDLNRVIRAVLVQRLRTHHAPPLAALPAETNPARRPPPPIECIGWPRPLANEAEAARPGASSRGNSLTDQE